MLNDLSFLTNSIPMDGLSTMAMIHSFKPWISGMVLLRIWNGTIPML